MLRKILLSHSPAYFFILPALCFLIIYSAYPLLCKDIAPHPYIFKPVFLSSLATTQTIGAALWSVPVALVALFLPMLTSRFGMFEKGMFLNGILWLIMVPSFMFFSGNLYALYAAVLVMPVYYFVFGMYKSESPVPLMFNGSFIISLAALFYLPALIFIVLIWAGWLFFNPFRVRAYLISLTGLVMPFFFVYSYFFLTDSIEQINIDLSFLNISDKSLKQQELLFSAFVGFFTLLGMIRLIAPGAVKKIGMRKNFNFCLFVFAVITAAMILTKDTSLLIFAFFPASVIANVSLSGTTRGWAFSLLFFLFLGLMLYFPFGQQIFG